LITSDEPLFRATAIINNTGDAQSIDYAKVYDVNGTEEHHIAATNSWSLGGTTNYWDFGAMLYTFTGTGIWDDPSNWEQNRVPAETDDIEVLSGATLIINGNKTINDIDIEGVLDIGGDTLIVNGSSDVADSIHIGTGMLDSKDGDFYNNGTIAIAAGGAVDADGILYNSGTLAIASGGTVNADGILYNSGILAIASGGTVDADSSFDGTNGTINFTGEGNLLLGSTVASLGTLSEDNGIVTYDGVDQTVFSDDYYSLTAGGGSGTKTLGGDVAVAGDLTIDTDVTIEMDTHNLTVTNATDIDGTLAVANNTLTLDGTSDIDGTITISTGTVDANGAFDANAGFVTFTDAGNLNLSSTVADLGMLSDNFGTVTYDGVNQIVFPDIYYNLTAGGGSGTKTLGGAVTVDNDLVIDAGVTFDVFSSENYSVSVGSVLENNGTFSAQEGTITFNGSYSQVFTPGSSTYYNITLNNAGDDKLLVIAGDLDIQNELTLTNGALDLDTNDPAISIGGDLAIISGTEWIKGDGTVTFDGVTQSLSDANTTPNDLGDALINSYISMTVATNVIFTSFEISSDSKSIVDSSVTLMIAGALTISGELEMADGSVVDAGGDGTVSGTLDMDGTSRLNMEGDLSFNGTMEADTDSRIDLDGSSLQTISGAPAFEPTFNSIFSSSSASVFNLTATINDTLDAGGEDFTISTDQTLTMASGSVTILSGGIWTRDGTLTLSTDSKVLYTSNDQSTMDSLTYRNVEHDGGILSQGGTFEVDGIFTNTSGNFYASENITANGIVWTGGTVGGLPSQTWDIGEDGIDINGGIFVATSDIFTVAGNWDMTGTGSFIPGTGTVIFDGTAPQSITSADQAFYSIQNSNILGTVSIADKFEIGTGGFLTIDESAVFATAGNEFYDHNPGSHIINNGTFEIYGDETFTTDELSIPGNTLVVGSIFATNLDSLENVEFNPTGGTVILGDDVDYIYGNILVAENTTFDMDIYDLTLANRKTITNEGIWSAPASGSQFICSGNAAFLGGDMNFSKFYAVSADTDTIIFKGSQTYTISDTLTLVGVDDGGELLITSDEAPSRATAIIDNTGDAQFVDYVKVFNVNGTEEHPITATNSWSMGGTTDYWNFAVMYYTFETTGNWDIAENWEQNFLPSETDNIQVLSGITLFINGNRTINHMVIDGVLDIGGDILIVNGSSVVADSIHIGTGMLDANGPFDATGAKITFTDAGNLTLDSTVTSLGILSSDNGTVTYDGEDQYVFADTYHQLIFDGIGGKTLTGDVSVNNNLIVNTGDTCIVGTNTITVEGLTDINGTITINSGSVDANGIFDAIGGTITFNGAGNLYLDSTVTSLGTFSASYSTVAYDGRSAHQWVKEATYHDLTLAGHGDKELSGDIGATGDIRIDPGVDFDVSYINNYSINIEGDWINNGTFNEQNGLVTFDGNDIQHIYSVDSLSGSNKQQDFYNLTINNTGATDTVVMGGDFDIKNNLTLESGTIDWEDIDPSIQIKGNLTISDGAVWIKGNKPLIFNGSTHFSDTNLQVSNLGRVEVMDSLFIFTDMAVDNLFIPSTGTFGHTPSLALYNTGDLVVNEEGAFDSDSISITFNGDTTQTISGVNNFYSLYIKSCDSCVVELSDTNDVIFVTNGVSIETGRLNLPYSSNLESLTINEKGALQSGDLIQLTGSWSNDGAFLHNNGKVIFKGVNQSINGNTDFYELTKETSVADTLTFEKETLQTIASKIDLIGGNVNNRLVLRSNSDDLSPVPFELALTQDGLQTLEYLRIKDGNVSNGDTLVCLYSQDAGGNAGWVFINSAPVISFPDEVLSYSEHDTLKLFGENEIITVSDLNDDSLSSAIVRISTNYYSTEDTLMFTEQNGITVDSTWGENGFVDSTGTLKLIGDDSLAVWAFVLKNVHYLNLSDNPMEEDRTIEISVNDGEKESAPYNRIIQVANVNDPLFITSQDSIYATEGTYFQYIGTASDPDDYLFTWNFHSFPSWMVTNSDSIYGIPPNYTRDTTFTAISSDGEFFDTLLVNVFITQINKPHPAVAVVQNNAFSNHFEFVVVDTMAKVIEEPRLTVSSTTDEEVSLTTIADFTFGGHHYFETIPGIWYIKVVAEGDVGVDSVMREMGITVAKAMNPWIGFSPDSLLRINGSAGAVRSDKPILVVDSTLFRINFRDRASYRIGNESMIFEKAVTVSIQSSDDLAIYRMEGDTWIELPSMSMNGQIVTYTKKMGYFRLGAKTMIIPEISSLHQNYPNPFNPVTTIMYDVGFLQGPNQKINISVYNILGQHITTLVDKYHEIGRHSLRWDSRDKWTKPVASGMYLVYMRSESGFVQTKKITVLK
jgi:hypothetical protein